MRPRRAAHVRPKPPASDRLKSRTLRSTPPAQELVRRYRPLRTGSQIPLPIGLAAIGLCLVLGLLTITFGLGLLGTVASQVGSAFGNAMAHLSSQAAPAAAPASGLALDTPVLDAPPNDGYTNQSKLNLTGRVPAGAIGQSGDVIRIYSIDTDNNRHQVAQINVGATSRFVSQEMTLTEGQNVYVASLVTPTGEGQLSPKLTYILDTKPPTITVSSPAQGTLQKSSSIDVVGKTDPGARVSIRNEVAIGGAPANQVVGSDGKFRLTVALVTGSNTIDITSVDQAGNPGTYTLSLRRDRGLLAAHLVVKPVRFSSTAHTTMTLTIHATTANGSPLANASVVFSIQVPGPAVMTKQMTTDSKGMATWQFEISSAFVGNGNASVLVTTASGDVISDSARFYVT